MSGMKAREIRCNSVLNKSGIPGIDYCINPYTGCEHGCSYCYADFIKRFTGHEERWGSFVDVKVNVPEVLERQLNKAKRGLVYFSSVTDPYQPLEREYELTRKCLKVLLARDFPVSIQTKSALVLRDLDLIKEFTSAEAGFTISLDDAHARKLEPQASLPSDRIKALKKIHNSGIKTFVFIGPIVPGLTDVVGIVRKTYDWADHYLIDRLNMKGFAKKNMKISKGITRRRYGS